MHDRHMNPGQEPGSRRSQNMTLDKLDEALSNLERRMGIGSAPRAPRPAPQRDDDVSAIRARQEALSHREPQSHRDDYARPYRQQPRGGYQPVAQDHSALHDELALLREELNREMSSTIAAQFGGIREELQALYHRGNAVSPEDLADGFSRVTRELGLVASRVENSDTGSLRAEIEEMKSHIASLAREDTLRDMADRWSVIEREIGALPQALDSRAELKAVSDRIAELGEALHDMPSSQSIGAMENQMRALAEAVEGLASQNASISPEHLNAIEDRLDEVTRAIVSISVSAQPQEFDTAPFDRIEARLSTLARQVEEQSQAQPTDKIEQRLMEIATRLDALHESTAAAPASNEAFETVAHRLDELTRRIDGAPAGGSGISDGVLEGLDARFREIAGRLESHQNSLQENGQQMLQSLDQRMEELARRIEENESESAAMPSFDHMERRIEEIAQMLTAGDGLTPAAAAQPDPYVLEGLEAQIAALSEKLSTVSMPAPDSAPVADLAPRLAAISDQLATGREDMIAAARQAAEEVVAKFSGGASKEQKQMLAQLAGDLRSLEELARNSDDRNTRTFEAIHDTLVKVAERIAGLELSMRSGGDAPAKRFASEQAEPAPQPPRMAEMPTEPDMPRAPEPAARMQAEKAQAEKPRFDKADLEKAHIEDAPPVDFAAGEQPRAKQQTRRVTRQGITPAEAAAMAARAAMSNESSVDEAEPADAADDQPKPEAKQSKGFLSGLRKSIRRGGKEEAVEPAVESEEPAVFGKAVDTAPPLELADEPLEPGSGAPDLAEIMKRVRAERAGPAATPGDAAADDAGKSDFIAAARRAARAAADEVAVPDRKKGEGKASGKGGMLASRRRPLMLAAGAILLAVMAFPLARGYLFDRGGGPADMAETAKPMVMDEPAKADLGTPAGAEDVAEVEPAEEMPAPPMRVVDAPSSEVTAALPSEPQAMDETGDAAMDTGSDMDMAADDGGEVSEMEMAEAPDAAPADEAGTDEGFQQVTLADIPDQIGPVALREAAVAGDAKALFVIGDRLMGKAPGDPAGDMKAAAHWYEMSAELGFAPAQYRIGNAYEKAMGVERDIDAAKSWYLAAAEQGNVSAMHNLAVLYATEIDGTRDMPEAVRWFNEAADHGVTDSQVNLGILSARGEGVAQDLAESYKWLALAAKAGDKDAGAKRDEVAGFMRPDQLQTARDAVDLWKAKPVDVAANSIEVPDAWKTGGEMTASAPISDEDMKKAVRNIQAILNNNGYDAGTPDGIMGSRTRNAIIEFQKANGLLPSGEVDRALVDKLLEVNKQS